MSKLLMNFNIKNQMLFFFYEDIYEFKLNI